MAQRRWTLSKYSHSNANKETWTQIEAQADNMWIQISHNYLQIINDDTLLECVALADANIQWKAVRRGPNILFKIKTDETSRKFRIRFANGEQNADQIGASCAQALSQYFQVRDADRESSDAAAGVPQTPQPPNSCLTLGQLTVDLLESHRHQRPSEPIPDLPELVRSCLMDPGFPSLVQSVEAALKQLTAHQEN